MAEVCNSNSNEAKEAFLVKLVHRRDLELAVKLAVADNPRLPDPLVRHLASHGQGKLVAMNENGAGPEPPLWFFFLFFPSFFSATPDLALRPSSMAVVTFAGVALHPDLAIHGRTRSGVVSLVHGRRRLRATPEGAMAARDDSSFVPAPTAMDSQIEEPAKKTRERGADRHGRWCS
ncbi:Glyco_transf_64 domain-containing protein [Psidium guajava]|nr:Glyco_transf_64 domain-containing protein [Psidium guajava]